MPPYTNSQAIYILTTWRFQRCRYLALSEQSKTLYQRCLCRAKCHSKDQSDRPNIIKSRSEPNSAYSGLNTFNSKAESSKIPQNIPDNIGSTQEQSNLTTPIIILIILFVFFSLLFLLFLFWKRKRAQHLNNSLAKKEEMTEGQALSHESALLNHNRISEESNAKDYLKGLRSVRSKSSTVSLEDVPIPDIEKELIVEPSLNTHPALKFIDVTNPYPHPGTRVAVPEIPSPLPSPVHQKESMSKRMSYRSPNKTVPTIVIAKSEGSVRESLSVNPDLSPWSKDSPDRHGSSGDTYESPKSDFEPTTPSSISEKGHRGRCERIAEESDEAIVRENFIKLETDSEAHSKIEIHPWHELFSKITRPKSPELILKDIDQAINKSSSGYYKKAAPTTQENSDQIHLMSNRWSNSTDELPGSPKNAASDCYIPGSWINSTMLDADNISANKTSNGYDTSDATKNFKSQKFIYLTLQSENSSPNPSVLDFSEKICARNECDVNDNTTENNDKNYKLESGLIERSETKTWRKWLKR